MQAKAAFRKMQQVIWVKPSKAEAEDRALKIQSFGAIARIIEFLYGFGSCGMLVVVRRRFFFCGEHIMWQAYP
jgi:hypothetical protein